MSYNFVLLQLIVGNCEDQVWKQKRNLFISFFGIMLDILWKQIKIPYDWVSESFFFQSSETTHYVPSNFTTYTMYLLNLKLYYMGVKSNTICNWLVGLNNQIRFIQCCMLFFLLTRIFLHGYDTWLVSSHEIRLKVI